MGQNLVTFCATEASKGANWKLRCRLMIHLAFVIGTVLLHGMFVMAEYAVVKAIGVDPHTASVVTNHRENEDIFRNIENHLKVCQIGKTIALMLTGLCLGFKLNAGSIGLFWLGFFSVVVVHTAIGFDLPKKLAINNNDLCLDWLAGFLRVCAYLLFPLVWLAKSLTRH